MHVDLLRSHKLWRFVQKKDWGVVTCIYVRSKSGSVIPYVISNMLISAVCVCVGM